MWIFKLWLICVEQNKIVDWQNFWWLNYREKRKGSECLSVFLLFFFWYMQLPHMIAVILMMDFKILQLQ